DKQSHEEHIMANLPEELKNEIILKLARYEGYSDIARSISTEYDVAVTRFQVRSYDPTKPTFAAGDKWRAIFTRERHKYITDTSDIPISHQAYRLNLLQRMLDKAMEARNFRSEERRVGKECRSLWRR